MIQRSCISCLAYLANFYFALALTDHSAVPAMESYCDAALLAIGRLTKGVVVVEYSWFDLLLGVSKPLHGSACFSPRRLRCAGRGLWRELKLERLPFPWGRPPSWCSGGRLLPMHIPYTRRNFLTVNPLYFPLCPYLRTVEQRILDIPTSYLLRHERI